MSCMAYVAYFCCLLLSSFCLVVILSNLDLERDVMSRVGMKLILRPTGLYTPCAKIDRRPTLAT